MFEFLLLLFIIFIVVPIARVAWTIYKVRRQYRQAFEAARAQSGRQQPRQERNRRGGWTVPLRKKPKVVDRSEGEYVEWEDISVTETTTDGTKSYSTHTESVHIEERVSDAEWEEIK